MSQPLEGIYLATGHGVGGVILGAVDYHVTWQDSDHNIRVSKCDLGVLRALSKSIHHQGLWDLEAWTFRAQDLGGVRSPFGVELESRAVDQSEA